MSGGRWVSLGAVVENALRPPLSDEEGRDWDQLRHAIEQAMRAAQNMPTTLDAHARGLIVQKLQEAEHWSLELLRAAWLERNA